MHKRRYQVIPNATDGVSGPAIPTGGSGLGTPSQVATVTTTIATILDLALTTGTTVPINFPDIASLDNGVTTTGAVSLTFRSNLPWFVNVAANSSTFSDGDHNTPMPSSVLFYKLGGTQTFIPLTTTASSVVGTTGAKVQRGAGTIAIDYYMNPRYDYGPGAYTLALTYTISNQ
ncbi:MAG TPA: hypothetical protein DCO83_01495 [Mucilaginibacter sp.]|nr:hypothetical protein [Mucilaginibacter sp.]